MNMITTLKEWKLYKESISNDIFKIAKIYKTIEIELDVEHTIHSIERTRRHDKDIISTKDIKETIESATKDIISSIIENKIDIGDRVLVTRKSDWLNIVGSLTLKTQDSDIIIFKVITVMKEQNFNNKFNTYQILI